MLRDRQIYDQDNQSHEVRLSDYHVAMMRMPRVFSSSLLITALALAGSDSVKADYLFEDYFENGLDHWEPLSADHVSIVAEPNSENHVLQLTPRSRSFSHALLKPSVPATNIRVQGRFQFPTQGDGYLGFIYNYSQGPDRFDFGCLYIKSNGSYVRVSPHYDGNPSWRLYEELRVNLTGDQKIQPGRWYDFRLDVQGRRAALFVHDMTTPVAVFTEPPTASGLFGLEARPGRGEVVWVDDITIRTLPAGNDTIAKDPPVSTITHWQYQPAITDPADADLDVPALDDALWLDLQSDSRGAVITGRLTQSQSGENSVVYLRGAIDVPAGKETGWLAISAANRVDVWFNGYYRGTAAPERFIWSDHVTNLQHSGARIPLLLKQGEQEIILRVHGDNFAGGGFFAEMIYH